MGGFCIRIVVLILVNGAISWPSNKVGNAEPQCGYNSCNPTKYNMINVHIVPHSHDDVGWRKTIDEYYYGLNEYIQQAGVQYIIGSVVDALKSDSKRRFIQVETAFFWKWYEKQNEQTREAVKEHVRLGKMEFIGGGWSMNDEACTHYQSTIDQFTYALKKLSETFGECGHPKVGWQIDPFGHSREMAAIFAQMGFDAFIFARTDFQERQLRESTKTNQMVWRSNPTLGSEYDIFTSILFDDAYSSPPWFCFDQLCTDPPIVDDPDSSYNNVDYKINLFREEIKKRVAVSPTNHIIIPLGGDFTMQNAHKTFVNIDKLIHYTNLLQANGSNYNLLYSTPSCYIKAIYDDTKGNRGFPLKTDDFLPYGTGNQSYWTGFYTSRPTLKRNERKGNNFLQVLSQLQTMSYMKNDRRIDNLRAIMGILQHHDAITGTEKQLVANDYTRLLFKSLEETNEVISNTLSKLTDSNLLTAFTNCRFTNISQCGLTETNKVFVVTVYNPLSRVVNKYVRLPVTGTNYRVTGPKGTNVAVQLVPVPKEVINTPGRNSSATHDLVFLAEEISPLGFKSYYVAEIAGNIITKSSQTSNIKFENINVQINQTTGLVNLIAFGNNLQLPVTQNFEEYYGVNYVSNTNDVRNSGAYVFNPVESAHKITEDPVNITVYEGELVKEIHQTFNDYVSQVVRIYSKENFVEFEWFVGPLSMMNEGKEVTSVFETNLATESTFYTETNGKQLMKRVKNYRPAFDFTVPHSISANYYPVTSKIVLRDEKADVEFSVINDRTQGGTSLKDGMVELMVHRACLADDDLGVEELLKETAFGTGLVVRGSHYVVAGSTNKKSANSSAVLEKDITQRKILDSWVFLSTPKTNNYQEYAQKHKMEFSGLTTSLPNNVQILSLEPWRDNEILLRLEHVFDVDENDQFSESVQVDLKNTFSTLKIKKLKETTLAANKWLEDSNRLRFDVHEDDFNRNDIKKRQKLDYKSLKDDFENLIVALKPSQIRTFIITAELQ